MTCKNSFCKKQFDEDHALERFISKDLQNHGDAVEFCSLKCMKGWLIRKLIVMVICIVIGFLLAISLDFPTGMILFFIPYMIRQCFGMLRSLFSGGSFGEFLAFFVVIMGSITFVFPLYKFIKEIIFFVKSFQEIKERERG